MTKRQDKAKAHEIEAWLDRLAGAFEILPMDARAFREWARLMQGRPEQLLEDAMIAATARVHGLTVVTRDTRDFAQLGISTINPFLPEKRAHS